MWGRFIYREILAPERLVWVNSFSDEHGGLARVPFSDAWPTEMLNAVTFAEAAEQTLVTITTRALNATDEEQKTFDTNQENMTQGWGGTTRRLHVAAFSKGGVVPTRGATSEVARASRPCFSFIC